MVHRQIAGFQLAGGDDHDPFAQLACYGVCERLPVRQHGDAAGQKGIL